MENERSKAGVGGQAQHLRKFFKEWKSGVQESDDELSDLPVCTLGCCFAWGLCGAVVAFVLFVVFGVLALVAVWPFEGPETTLGVVLLVLGLTGAASGAAYVVLGIPGLCLGYCLDSVLRRRAPSV